MNTSDIHRIYDRQANWLFVGVVAAGLAEVITQPKLIMSFYGLVLLALSVVYILVAIYGGSYAEHHLSSVVALYYGFQILLCGVIIFISVWQFGEFMLLIIFPLASQSAHLPNRGMLAVCGIILLVTIGPVWYLEGVGIAIQASLSMSVGIAFVVLFSRIAFRELSARAEVERLATELGQANQQLREYAVQVEELATTQERNRLAREIHDSLGHYLTVINVQLEAAKTVLQQDVIHALDALSKAQHLTQDGLAEVRRSVATLRTSPLDNRSLPEVIKTLAEENQTTGVVTELTVRGTPRSLDPPAKLTLYRAVQEGLTNVRKHAQASHISLTLDYSDEKIVRLVVQDNGLGVAEANITNSFGLLGIRERVKLLGGEVHTRSKPGAGFTLEVRVPSQTMGEESK
jgi:signal transduction histidine kinase